MLPFGVTIPAAVPQRSEIPEGLMNYPVSSGGKGSRCLGLTVLPLSCADYVDILGAPMESFNGVAIFVIFVQIVCRCVRKITKKRLLASSCLSVRPSAWNISAPTGRIYMKLDI